VEWQNAVIFCDRCDHHPTCPGRLPAQRGAEKRGSGRADVPLQDLQESDHPGDSSGIDWTNSMSADAACAGPAGYRARGRDALVRRPPSAKSPKPAALNPPWAANTLARAWIASTLGLSDSETPEA
jgi:hypothetical protein